MTQEPRAPRRGAQQVSESYHSTEGRFSMRINKRIAQGWRVVAAFGGAHVCTVIYEREVG